MKVTITELRKLIAEAIKECGDMWVEPSPEMDTAKPQMKLS